MLKLLTLTALLGCSGNSVRAVFHPTDPAFRGAPASAPPKAYLERDIAEVPRTRMRSVGLIKVTVPESSGIERAVELAVEKGRELGCWIIVEHAAFVSLQSSAALSFGARVYLTHGGGGGDSRSSDAVTAEFDCVLQAEQSA